MAKIKVRRSYEPQSRRLTQIRQAIRLLKNLEKEERDLIRAKVGMRQFRATENTVE